MKLKLVLSLIFLCDCIFIWLLNTFIFQAFCVPVDWAMAVLLSTLAAFFILPFTGNRWLQALCVFLNGIFAWICIYCSWYMLMNNEFILCSIFFFGIGLWPLAFLCMSIFNSISIKGWPRLFYFAGLTVPLCVIIIASTSYSNTVKQIQKEKNTVIQIPHTYWGERITGLHFKYGSSMCLYDGWRPPLHDPLLVVMLRLHGDPLHTDLNARVQLYRKFFPDYPVQINCTCNQSKDARSYLSDSLFN